jgi:LPXTG-motif cell wall-anchored protein
MAETRVPAIRRCLAASALAAMAVLFTAGVAAAQDTDDCYPDCQNTTTTGQETTTTSGGGSSVGTEDTGSTSSSGGSLPVTGGDVVGLAVVGVVLTGAGTALVLGSRRREEPTA